MSSLNTYRLSGILSCVLALGWTSPGFAQTFNSGSTGALGALNPTANTTVVLPPDGILNYTTVTIPSGVTVTFQRNTANTPVTMLATGDVTIGGTIRVDGANGLSSGSLAAQGGPGGFPGGVGGAVPITGYAPVGGAGPGGGAPGGSGGPINATYGAPTSFVLLVPLFGGSGGGGGIASTIGVAGGGGGGGAMVIASTTRITIASTGLVSAAGGAGAQGVPDGGNAAGGASGGAIRLVAPIVAGSGQLSATGGSNGATGAGAGGPGRIRIEAATNTFTGSVNPPASISSTLGPVTPASTPPLTNLPTLTISAVSGMAFPVAPTGAYASADVSVPQGTANPVSVTLTATNVPVPTPFTIQVIPQLSGPTTVTGTLTSPIATVLVTLPRGEVSQLVAVASFTVPTQSAALFPLIDGEPVEQMLVTTRYGEPSAVTLLSRSGKTRQAGAERERSP